MDDLMLFSFAGNVQSDELTQDGSDQDWQEYGEWLEAQEQSEECDPSDWDSEYFADILDYYSE